MCGVSKEEKMAFANEQTVSGLLTKSFQDVFGANMNILESLTTALKPIVSAGPNQFGFSKEETAAMRTEATDRLASAGAQESNAVRSAMASRGGGNVYLPSGAQASIEAALAEDTAQKEASAQLGITRAGYEVGRQNFWDATSGLARMPGELEGPITSMGGAAMGAAGQELKGAQAITAADRAWEAPVAGLVGGLVGMIPGMAPVGAAIGTASKSLPGAPGTGGDGG